MYLELGSESPAVWLEARSVTCYPKVLPACLGAMKTETVGAVAAVGAVAVVAVVVH